MFSKVFASLRYNLSAPMYYFILTIFITFLVLTLVFGVFHAKESRFISEATSKAYVLKQALIWQYRAVRYDGMDKAGVETPHSSVPGTIEGMTKEGKLVVRYPYEGRFVDEAFEMADLKLINVEFVAKYVNDFKLQSINIDIYKTKSTDLVVIWMQSGKPLNLMLIEEQLATPVENPPTNIVNLLMAAYYWNKF